MPYSVHSLRWINQVADEGWDLHLFPSADGEPLTDFRNLTIYNLLDHRPNGLDSSVRIVRLRPRLRVPGRVSRYEQLIYARPELRSTMLAGLILWLRPDIVHSFQSLVGADLTWQARNKLQRWLPRYRFPKWVVSNWGGDVMFGRLPEHAVKIRRVMASSGYLCSEAQQFLDVARKNGFKGTALPVLPASGGFDLDWMRSFRTPGPTSARRLVVLKGFHGSEGRALVGLRAVERCADVLRDYSISVYLPGYYLSGSVEVREAVDRVRRSTGLAIDVDPPRGWTREEVLRLHGRARVSIGLSITDGLSTSLLEAMMLGSFPIQSATGCQDEWLRDGETAFFVHPDEPMAIEAALRRALSDDGLVDRAAVENAKATDWLERRLIQPRVVEMYRQVARSAGE
jgi:hypothetical protein